jgi:8-oxo-dGTP pyrophosphatase MutT (NUDIX family)
VRVDLDRLRESLASVTPEVSTREGKRAAVAMIVRETAIDSEILFIRRADHPLDPWSGHMAFPGGRADPEDGGDLLVTALRETAEEIGVDLRTHGELLGHLSDIPAIARGKFMGMVIRPYVVVLRGEPTIVPNHEVAEVVWSPLSPMLRGESATTYPYVHEGNKLLLPAHLIGERVVWGLTHQMVEAMLALLRR